jgi:YesN/AraC family two-component response regulator
MELISEIKNHGALKKPSILIVDDERVICEGFERLLSAEYKIYKTYNGEEALEKIRRNRDISIVICDIMMPVMDGIEMIEKVRSENTDIIIIVISGSFLDENVNYAIEKYADIHFIKPIDISQLELTLKNVLEN